jgi:hypothetical protein
MGFRKWLLEAGMGGGGVGSGMAPPLQRPEATVTAMADHHGEGHRDPRNQYGKLPPAKKRSVKK